MQARINADYQASRSALKESWMQEWKVVQQGIESANKLPCKCRTGSVLDSVWVTYLTGVGGGL